MEWIQGLDHDILLYIAQHVRQDWLTPIVTLITSLGKCRCHFGWYLHLYW